MQSISSAPAQVTQTSIFSVFGEVDEILADVKVLLARSPTYAQFGTALNNITAEVAANSAQLVSIQNQLGAILSLLQAIISGMATLGNQQTELNDLQQVLAILQRPRTIGIDVAGAVTVPQLRPHFPKLAVDVENVVTTSQPTPGKPGP